MPVLISPMVSNDSPMENEAFRLAAHRKWGAAARMMTRVAKTEPHITSRWIQIAYWHRRDHNLKAAIRTLQTALRLNLQLNVQTGADPFAELKKKSASGKARPGRQIDEACITGHASAEDLIELWEALSEAQLEAQDWPGCIATCQTLLQHAPHHHFGQEILATAFLQTGEIDKAVEVMRHLLQLSPRDPLHRLKLATLLQLRGNFGEALREFQRVVETHPDLLFVEEAHEAIEALDRMQTQQILLRAAEEHAFRLHLQQDFDATLEDGGFYLSEAGRESLRHMLWDGRADDTNSIPPPRVH
ncbi:MAG: tetratricopeptide repeat protein [Armatimonadota bacterium]|nr:tetratricopeptide repeat protein [Armatimonadota bacterium]